MKLNVPAIKRLMAMQRLTQIELADKAGLSRQSIGGILARGTSTVVNAGKLADALGVDVSEIWDET